MLSQGSIAICLGPTADYLSTAIAVSVAAGSWYKSVPLYTAYVDNFQLRISGEAIIDGEMSRKIDAGKIIVGKTGKLTADAVANYVNLSREATQKTVATI